MKTSTWFAGLTFTAIFLFVGLLSADRDDRDEQLKGNDAKIRDHAAAVVRDGRHIFRFDTFGSEAFWAARFGCMRR